MSYKRILEQFGAAPSDILEFNADEYDNFDYLELINREEDSGGLTGVIQRQDRTPVLYVVDYSKLSDDSSELSQQIEKARTVVACRGDSEWLAVVKPGCLSIYQCNFQNQSTSVKELALKNNELFVKKILNSPSNLELARITGLKQSQKFLNELLFDLFQHISGELTKNKWLAEHEHDILSLLGRALFTRFLIDRKIINSKTFPELYRSGDVENCFETPDLAAITSQWLDDKFNGDLLPLSRQEQDVDYKNYFNVLHDADASSLKELSKLLYKTTISGQYFLDIARVDFSFVPVGLLSQVYENYAHRFSESAHNESVYYTPLHIAKYMVDQAFSGLTTCKTHEAIVLDPTAGGGIFLVLCFKKLVAEYWKNKGERPDTRKIREILNTQIRGFDINEYALKLSALSLYLTAIELDPNPFPPEKLKFNKLIGNILIPTREEHEPFPAYPVLGSLGGAIGNEHSAKYDLVIGNPPWTKWKNKAGKAINNKVEEIIRAIISDRSPELEDIAVSYRNEQNFSDTPFVWKCMVWAKPEANISLAIHARLLFRNSKDQASPLQAIFKSLKVTGILNGSALRQTQFWPKMDQPFCLLFAKNKLPKKNDAFYFITPCREKQLNDEGKATIDYKDAYPITFGQVYNQPSIFKVLFRGSILDLALINKLESLNGKEGCDNFHATLPLKEYWNDKLGLSSGEGYQASGDRNSTENLLAIKPKHIRDPGKLSPLVDVQELEDFRIEFLHRPRNPEIYKPPLIMLRHTFSAKREQTKAYLSVDAVPIVYYESFYGFSAHTHPSANALAMYLFALFNSDLFYYYQLMTSSKYGVEREQVYKEDIDSFPIIPFEAISENPLDQLKDMVSQANKNSNLIDDLSDWINHIYGVTSVEKVLIKETLENNSPTSESLKYSEGCVDDEKLSEFSQYLNQELNIFLNLDNKEIFVDVADSNLTTWKFITLSKRKNSFDLSLMNKVIKELSGGKTLTKLIVENAICLGMPNQSRYWTKSRARLLVQELLKDIENFN